MRILVDTNVLCRLAERRNPHHAVADAANERLRDSGHELCLVPQVLYEYWVVATRPMEQNGLGMTPPMVDRAIELWLDLFNLLRDERGVFSIWHELVRQHHVRGKNAHDARLVAAMRRHNLVHLLTFNASDFQRYSEITVLDARTVDAEP